MTLKRLRNIVLAGVMGAFIGSFIGIAALGSAIAGTWPCAALGVYLMYGWTRPKAPKAPATPATTLPPQG